MALAVPAREALAASCAARMRSAASGILRIGVPRHPHSAGPKRSLRSSSPAHQSRRQRGREHSSRRTRSAATDLPQKRLSTDGEIDPRPVHLRRQVRRSEETCQKSRWAVPESTWNSVASPRNVLFQGIVKSITVRWDKAVSTVGLDERWLRRSGRRPVFVRILQDMAKPFPGVKQTGALARHLFGTNRPGRGCLVQIHPSYPLWLLWDRHQDLH